jgi:hypothetical protein
MIRGVEFPDDTMSDIVSLLRGKARLSRHDRTVRMSALNAVGRVSFLARLLEAIAVVHVYCTRNILSYVLLE